MREVMGRSRRISSYKREYHRHKSHIQDIHHRARHLTNETLESTTRIKHLVNKTHSIGIQTSAKLSAQEGQLSESESHLNSIHDSLRSAHRNLRKLEHGEELQEKRGCRWFCYFCCKCYKCRNIDEPDQHHANLGALSHHPNPSVKSKLQKSLSAMKLQYPKNFGEGPNEDNTILVKIKNDSQEKVMEKNLHEVTSLHGTLKGLASDLETGLSKSTKQIDRLKAKTFNEHSNLAIAEDRTMKLIKK